MPINLRPWFPTETLRNFILTTRLCIDPALGEYTFPEIVRYVHDSMRLHLNRLEMQAIFTGMCALPPTVCCKPSLFFKEPHHGRGVPKNRGTAVLCYLYQPRAVPGAGEDGAPYPPYGGHPGAGYPAGAPLCCVSYGDTMAVTFAGTGVSSETERRFFTHLVRDGISVKVESNRVR